MAGVITNDNESFIDSVEKRPALYLKSLKEYSDVNYRRKLWEEVCLEVVSGWAELDDGTKTKVGAQVQKKWLNFRTCFSRELKAQQTKSGQAASKRRRYIYFEKLLFLKSSLAQRPTETNIDSDDDEENTNMEAHESDETPQPAKQPNTKKRKTNAHGNTNFQESLLKILHEDLDEDKNFALSLIPSLKSLTEDEKLQAKIQILQVFRTIKTNRVAGFQQPNYQFNQLDTQQPSSSHSSTPRSQDSMQSYWMNFSTSPESDIIDL